MPLSDEHGGRRGHDVRVAGRAGDDLGLAVGMLEAWFTAHRGRTSINHNNITHIARGISNLVFHGPIFPSTPSELLRYTPQTLREV
jgi:hypothetical protein